ncbi:hypothetical protein [Streptomyces sp. NBC_00576]|uniref:hypothetical protein n=1 Tax=Streptomyces sp. NBC_00576 TaxID=2903665 RepID=UPI002E81652A|nr:hypothetical protein [Streptomyces sp. NBC_00576]WUB76930.1 hypothetical protein OG734_46690 [Streptomyces sp. NBC_00576]
MTDTTQSTTDLAGHCDVSLFLGQWLRSPSRIGAIAPSSRHLARAVTCAVPERGEPVVVAALGVRLTDEETAWLEDPYTPRQPTYF